MAYLDVNDVRLGTVVTADITAHDGQVLLRAGTPLTAAHRRLLKRHHIGRVSVAISAAEFTDPSAMPQEKTGNQSYRRDAGPLHPFLAELSRVCR